MRSWALTLGLGAAIGLLTWHEVLLYPHQGLDPSWQVALHLAAADQLHQGSEFVFTYGPLGFLEIPVATFGATGVLSGLYIVIGRVLLGATLLWAAGRSFPLPAAALLALAVAALTPAAVVPVTIALVWCLIVLQDDPPGARPILFAAGGVLAGLELLIKLNVGLLVPFLLLVTALALEGGRWRNVLTFFATFIPTAAILWFASGQGLGNLGDFLSSSIQIISGYSEALGIEAPAVRWDRAAAVVAIAATLAATFLATRSLPGPRRIAALTIVAATLFVLGKQGYVRHDPAHVELFVGGVVAPWLAFRWAVWQRALAVAAVGVTVVASPFVTERGIDESLDPGRAFEQVTALFNPSERSAESVAETREKLTDVYELPRSMIDAIGERPIQALPWETNLLWAYDLNWRPLPVIQDYAAYTNELDDLNAEALADPDGPELLLRHLGPDDTPPALDGRYPPFDAPATTRAMLCNFRSLETTASYQLLARSRPHCGSERELGTVEAQWGEAVPVPPAPDAHSAVLARIEGTEVEGLERLRTLLYRAATRRVWLDGDQYRLTPQAGPQGLLLSLPATLDYPSPFLLAQNPATLMVTTGDGVVRPRGPLEITFVSLPVAAPRPGTGARAPATPAAASDTGG